LFFVELGAWIIVASTMVPRPTVMPARASSAFDRLEDALPQPVPLQEVTELADRRLVGDSLAPQVNPDERPHRGAIVERFLNPRIAQVEPVLQEVHSQHSFDTDRRSSNSAFSRIVALDDSTEALPRDGLVHLTKKLRSSGGLSEALKAGRRKGHLLVRHGNILSRNQHRVNQSIP
jgi:hypothetical protein